MPTVHATNENFFQEIDTSVPVVIDFWADWCGPCKVLSPVLESLSDKFEGSVKVIKVDVMECQELANQFKVSAIPYIVTMRNGEIIQSFSGFKGKDHLEKVFESLL